MRKTNLRSARIGQRQPGCASSGPDRRMDITPCVIHCLLTPVVLSISSVSAHFLPSEERTHRALAVAIAALGAIALLKRCRTSVIKRSCR